jgi:hypothetical protein
MSAKSPGGGSQVLRGLSGGGGSGGGVDLLPTAAWPVLAPALRVNGVAMATLLHNTTRNRGARHCGASGAQGRLGRVESTTPTATFSFLLPSLFYWPVSGGSGASPSSSTYSLHKTTRIAAAGAWDGEGGATASAASMGGNGQLGDNKGDATATRRGNCSLHKTTRIATAGAVARQGCGARGVADGNGYQLGALRESMGSRAATSLHNTQLIASVVRVGLLAYTGR